MENLSLRSEAELEVAGVGVKNGRFSINNIFKEVSPANIQIGGVVYFNSTQQRD